jgi:predicted alpha/beta superfamily hydrolase
MIAAKSVQPTAFQRFNILLVSSTSRMTTVTQPATYDRRAQLIELPSAALGIPKRFYVYIPPGYAASAKRLPVLYLFRGHEREWINPEEDNSRHGRTIIDVYEELLAAGTVGPMLLVFPGISSDDNSMPGLLVNFKQPALTTQPGIGAGQFEDYFLKELIPYVEAHYHADPNARSVDGFSLGGFMAVKLAAQHPHLFCSVGAFDGLYFWDDVRNPHAIARHDTVFLKSFFDPAFGVPRDRQYAAANNPNNLVRNGDAAALQCLTWIIEHGPRSAEPYASNYYRGERLLRVLREKQIENRGRGAIEAATHTWHWADEHMRYALPLHWQASKR